MAQIKPRRPRRKRPQLTSLRNWCKTSWKNTRKLAQQNSRFTGILLTTLLLGIILILATFLPSKQPCEGSLTLQSLSFESTHSQPLLVNTQPLQQVTLTGNIPITLSGQFSNSPSLKNQNSLQLTPINNNAIIQLTALPEADLELTELTLEPQTQVEQLRYDTYNKRLTFRLSNTKPNRLTLNPNGSFSVQIQGYKIEDQPNLSQNDPFTWQPDNQLNLQLIEATEVDLQFAELIEQSFWGRLAVRNVKLDEPNVRAQDYNVQYTESTILSGNIRLADKSQNLEAKQFLNFAPSDSIDSLMRLSLAEAKAEVTPGKDQILKLNTSEPGIKLDFSGNTRRIEIGLNPKNPVAKLQASLLEAWMPRDAVIGLIAFLSTMIVTLIGWLWEIASEPSQP